MDLFLPSYLLLFSLLFGASCFSFFFLSSGVYFFFPYTTTDLTLYILYFFKINILKFLTHILDLSDSTIHVYLTFLQKDTKIVEFFTFKSSLSLTYSRLFPYVLYFGSWKELVRFWGAISRWLPLICMRGYVFYANIFY